MLTPFLLRDVLDHAIPDGDTTQLAWLVGAMIAISVATGVISVGQTWLSNLVAQRVSAGEPSAAAVVSFATAASGHGFGRARTLERVAIAGTGRFVGAPAVRLAVNGADHAALAWTGAEGAHFVTRLADVSQGHVEAPTTVSPLDQDAALDDLAATPARSG